MNKKQGLAPVVIILIVVVIIAGGYFTYQSFFKPAPLCWPYCPGMTDQDREVIKESALKAETASWKTYNNEKYGFEFRYPSDWVIKSERTALDSANNFFLILDLSDAESHDSLTVEASREEGLLKYEANSKDGIFIEENGDVASFFRISLEHGNYRYNLWFLKNAMTVSELYKSITSTFEFIEPAPDTSLWKTYRNEKLGYEIKIPSGAVLTTDNLNLGAAEHKEVKEFPPNAPYVTISSGGAFVSICDDCGGFGVGIGNTKVNESFVINGKTYESSGFYRDDQEGTSKTMFLNLPNINIRYGFHSEFGHPFTAEEIEKLDKLAKQILSTFKFTK